MEDEKTVTRMKVERLERDVEKMQSTCDSRGEKLNGLDKSAEISKLYQKQIMENLATITLNIAKMTGSVAETLATANSLKVVTDRQTVDIKIIGERVETIEKLPLQNSNRLKWQVISIVLVNVGAFIVYLVGKVFL